MGDGMVNISGGSGWLGKVKGMAASNNGIAGRWLALSQEARRLFGLAVGLMIFGLVYGGTGLQDAVSSIDNHKKFAHGQHVAASVNSTQRTKGVYASVVLTYSVDGREYKSAVKDPNSIDQELATGQSVDAVYLPAEPQSVVIAGQYGTGFQGWSVFAAASGAVMVMAGLTCLVAGIKTNRRVGQLDGGD